MSPMRTVLVWGIPFALVVVALGYETDWGSSVVQDAPAPASMAPSPVAVSLLPEYAIEGGVAARSETVSRTLFNPTRRPAPPATQTAASGGLAQHGQFTLTGTTVMGNVATAFLRETKGGKSYTVRQGEALNGVTVAEVRPDYVKLSQGGEVEELRLKIASGPKTTVQVAAPAPTVPASPVGVPGGTANNAATGVPVRPPAAPPNVTRNGPAAATSVSELLAERRRAARAAVEAREQGKARVAQ